MSARKLLLIFVLSLFGLFIPATVSAQEMEMKLLTGGPIAAGSSFRIAINVNTQDIRVIAADALINFDETFLSITSVENGGFFGNVAGSKLTEKKNTYLVSGWQTSVAYAKGNRQPEALAILNLKALRNGTTMLSLECQQGRESDSNLNQADQARDILDCSKLLPLTVTAGQSITGNFEDKNSKIIRLVRQLLDKFADKISRLDQVLVRIKSISERLKSEGKDVQSVENRISQAETTSASLNRLLDQMRQSLAELPGLSSSDLIKNINFGQVKKYFDLKQELRDYHRELQEMGLILRIF